MARVVAATAARVSVMRFQTNGETVSGNVTKDGVHLDAIGKFTLRRGNLPSGSRKERGMAAVLGSIPAVGIARGVGGRTKVAEDGRRGKYDANENDDDDDDENPREARFST